MDCPSRTGGAPQDMREKPHELSSIKKVIGVVSGKGGVGKSMTSAMLAVLLNRRGYHTAVLDADVTGPSIPKLFGLHGRAAATEQGIIPVRTRTGIDVMSVNLLLENETDPVVWRGPVIAGAVKQFWQDVIWKDVDFMFVDMPPGTGDVPLTVFQSLPVDGIIVPVLGVVENMAWAQCPHCGEKLYVFGESHVEEVAAAHGLPVLARCPLDPQLAKQADLGVIESFEGEILDKAADVVENLL